MDKKDRILQFLQQKYAENPKYWYGPTDIGIYVFGYEAFEASSRVSKLIKTLLNEKKLERSPGGKYRCRLTPFIAAELARIAKREDYLKEKLKDLEKERYQLIARLG